MCINICGYHPWWYVYVKIYTPCGSNTECFCHVSLLLFWILTHLHPFDRLFVRLLLVSHHRHWRATWNFLVLVWWWNLWVYVSGIGQLFSFRCWNLCICICECCRVVTKVDLYVPWPTKLIDLSSPHVVWHQNPEILAEKNIRISILLGSTWHTQVLN